MAAPDELTRENALKASPAAAGLNRQGDFIGGCNRQGSGESTHLGYRGVTTGVYRGSSAGSFRGSKGSLLEGGGNGDGGQEVKRLATAGAAAAMPREACGIGGDAVEEAGAAGEGAEEGHEGATLAVASSSCGVEDSLAGHYTGSAADESNATKESQRQQQQVKADTTTSSSGVSSTVVESSSRRCEAAPSSAPASRSHISPDGTAAANGAAGGSGGVSGGRCPWANSSSSSNGLSISSSTVAAAANHWAAVGALGGTIGPGVTPSDSLVTRVTTIASDKGSSWGRGWCFSNKSSSGVKASGGTEDKGGWGWGWGKDGQQERKALKEEEKKTREEQQRKRRVQQHLQEQQQQLRWKLDSQEQMVGSRVIWMGEFVHLVRPVVYVLLLKK